MENEEPEDNLFHCIYSSAATTVFSSSELEKLLSQARRNNKALGITGMLLYEDGSFFQILEGAEHVVKQLYTKIATDKRHSKITKLILEPIAARNFADWSMGHAAVSTRQLSEIEGLNDFFQSGKCFIDLDDGRAKKLLKAFKRGQWRSTIAGK